MAKEIDRRKFLRYAGLTAASVVAAGCTPQASTPAPSAPAATAVATAAPAATAVAKKGGTLTYIEAGDFTGFIPWRMEAQCNAMYNQVFDRLVWKDGQGKEHLGIAQSWELAKDGLSATVKMRENVKWHDGKEHVAQDYVDIYGYTKDETLAKDLGVSKTKALMAPVKDVKAVDKYTVQFDFSRPLPYFTEILDYLWAARIDDKADPSSLKKLPVGTGPFKITEWVPNQYTRYVRNPDYFIQDRPYIDEFMFKRLEKAETLLSNLQSGAADGIFVTNPSDMDTVKADAKLWAVINTNAGSTFCMPVNVLKPPFDKKEVRQALSYSLNRVDMAKKAFFGISQPICTPFYSPTSLGYREDLVMAHPFDLDKAAKLLEKAGVKNLEFAINTTPRWPQFKLYALIWQADLAKIGVKLQVNEVEQAKFMADNGVKDMGGQDLYPWTVGRTTRDPAIFFSTQTPFAPGKPAKHGWINAECEKLIADAAVELDPAKRKQAYQRCNEILLDEVPVIELATDPRNWAWYKKVSDVIVDQVGNLTLIDAKIA